MRMCKCGHHRSVHEALMKCKICDCVCYRGVLEVNPMIDALKDVDLGAFDAEEQTLP